MNWFKARNVQYAILFVVFNFMLISAFAQFPQTFKYQSVVRGPDGTVMSGMQVGIMIKILQNNPSGNVVYEETYSPTTNEFGLVSLEIGSQDPEYFVSIDWGDGPYFLEISVDMEQLN